MQLHFMGTSNSSLHLNIFSINTGPFRSFCFYRRCYCVCTSGLKSDYVYGSEWSYGVWVSLCLCLCKHIARNHTLTHTLWSLSFHNESMVVVFCCFCCCCVFVPRFKPNGTFEEANQIFFFVMRKTYYKHNYRQNEVFV